MDPALTSEKGLQCQKTKSLSVEQTFLFYTQKSQLHYQDDTTLTLDSAYFQKTPLLQCMCCLTALLIKQLSNEEYVIAFFLFKLYQC